METVTFQIDTDAAENCTVEAERSEDRAEILRVTDADGNEVATTLDDLDRFEAVLFPEETTLDAIDPQTGTRERFRVRHDGEHIGRIYTGSGYRVPRSSETFTEVAESFHIDRQWQMMEDSDVAGYARRCYC